MLIHNYPKSIEIMASIINHLNYIRRSANYSSCNALDWSKLDLDKFEELHNFSKFNNENESNLMCMVTQDIKGNILGVLVYDKYDYSTILLDTHKDYPEYKEIIQKEFKDYLYSKFD